MLCKLCSMGMKLRFLGLEIFFYLIEFLLCRMRRVDDGEILAFSVTPTKGIKTLNF